MPRSLIVICEISIAYHLYQPHCQCYHHHTIDSSSPSVPWPSCSVPETRQPGAGGWCPRESECTQGFPPCGQSLGFLLPLCRRTHATAAGHEATLAAGCGPTNSQYTSQSTDNTKAYEQITQRPVNSQYMHQ